MLFPLKSLQINHNKGVSVFTIFLKIFSLNSFNSLTNSHIKIKTFFYWGLSSPLRIGRSSPYQQRHSPPCRGSSAQIPIINFWGDCIYGCDMSVEQVQSPNKWFANPFTFLISTDLSLNRFQRENRFPSQISSDTNITFLYEKSK